MRIGSFVFAAALFVVGLTLFVFGSSNTKASGCFRVTVPEVARDESSVGTNTPSGGQNPCSLGNPSPTATQTKTQSPSPTSSTTPSSSPSATLTSTQTATTTVTSTVTGTATSIPTPTAQPSPSPSATTTTVTSTPTAQPSPTPTAQPSPSPSATTTTVTSTPTAQPSPTATSVCGVRGPAIFTSPRGNFTTTTFSVTPDFDSCVGQVVTVSFTGTAIKPVQLIEICANTNFITPCFGIESYPSGTTSVTYSKNWTVTPYNGLGYDVAIRYEDQTSELFSYPFFTGNSQSQISASIVSDFAGLAVPIGIVSLIGVIGLMWPRKRRKE